MTEHLKNMASTELGNRDKLTESHGNAECFYKAIL